MTKSIAYPDVNILLIEDNPGDVVLIRELLNEAVDFEFKLTSTDELNDGLNKIKNKNFDVILLDLSLPDSRGFETLNKTKKYAKNTPIVILTGLNDEDAARKAVQQGAQDYLVKGQIDSNPLARSIYHAIDRNKMMQTIQSLASALQKEKKRLKEIIERNADGIIIVDQKEIVRFLNKAAESFFETTKKKIIGEKFPYPPMDLQDREITHQRKDGTITVAETNLAQFKWEGEEMHLISIRDITEKKKAQKKIYELATFPSDNPSPVLRVNKKDILYVNESASSLFKLKKGDKIPPSLRQLIAKTAEEHEIKKFEKKIGEKFYSLVFTPIEGTNYINIYGMDITDLRRAKEAKQRTEEQYSELFNHITDAVFIHDLKGKMLAFNKAAMKELGYSREELMQLGPMDFDVPKFAKKVPELIEKISNQSELIFQTEHLTKGGTSIPVEINAKLISYQGKKAILSVARDITERKHYENKIKKSEKRYRDLFEKSPYPIIISNLDGKIVDFNSALINKCGYSQEEIIHRSFNDTKLISAEYMEYFKAIFQQLAENKEIDPIEVKCFTKNNDLLWLRLNFSLINLENEKMVYILGQDITELKQSKQRLQKTEKSLQEVNVLIEDAPLAIVLLKPEGKILRVNREARDLFECTSSDQWKTNIYKLFPEKELDKVIRHYKENIYYPNSPNKLEVTIRSFKDHLIEVEITSTILKISNNIIIQSFISDITKRKQHEKNRKRLLDQLLSSLEFKSKFLATMSHELRTPLNAIIGFSTILLEESYGELNDEQKDFLNDVHSASNHLEELINSVLDFSKIEAGKFDLNIKRFKIMEIVKEVQSLIKPIYEKKGLKFNCNGINGEHTLIADPLRFKQILNNLLSNAIKFTNDGSIDLIAIEQADHWEFRIIDSGIGIKEKNYDVVFREFGRVEDDIIEEVSGAGLGLALTKRLVQLHGGEIWFESDYGEGTKFFFTIPKREG